MSKSTPKQKAKAEKAKTRTAAKPSLSKAGSSKKPKLEINPKTTANKTALPKTAHTTTPKKSIKSIRKVGKTPAKPTAPSKARSKQTKANPTKTASKDKAISKTKMSAKVITPKDSPSTLKELRQNIAGLETRMKRADTLTRKSVKALETAIISMDARTRKDRSTDKGVLTRKVNQLSDKLTNMVTETQNSINSELKTALSNPSVENLRAALFKADQRLSLAETQQSDAIAKINRHLASIATAVDARITHEEHARKVAIETLKTTTTDKIGSIEKDTASAFSNIGDKIAELSVEIKKRSEASELSIREKVSEIALKTQSDFKDYRESLEDRIDSRIDTQLEARIDSISQSDTGDMRRFEHTLSSLTSRLEELEHSVANFNAQAPAPDITPTTLAADIAQPEMAAPQIEPAPQAPPPKLSVVKTMPITAAAPPPQTPSNPDAFTPAPQTNTVIPPNPYSNAQAANQGNQPLRAKAMPPQDNHVPQEFDPRAFVREPQPTQASQPQGMVQTNPLVVTPPVPPQVSQVAAPPAHNLQPISVPTAQVIPETYGDPAYAENMDTLASSRIGAGEESGFSPPKISGRNLRAAAMATGVAVLGLVAAKGLLGDKNNPVLHNTVQKEASTATVDSPPTVIEPIGNYADNKPTPVTGEAAKTLNSAAAAGDAVAQFQLGLSYLEQDRTDEGVDLIRKSANQNQPAAQYRLAKLYELGEGVTQDTELARQLTERAARNGNRIAMHDLALYYAEGRGGVSAELQTAAKWFEKAAERGVVDSQFNLGVLFESGQGLPQSQTDAYVWYAIAAKQGDQFAKKRVDILSDTMDSDDLSTAIARIAKFAPVKIDEQANGIFRNLAWIKPVDGKAIEVNQTRQAQSLLTDLGYDIGSADGTIGPRTRAAIISFEEANGLPETGRVNAALIDRLELAAGV